MYQFESIGNFRLSTVDSSQRGEDDCSNKFSAAIRLVTLCHGGLEMRSGENCNDFLLRLVVVGRDVEVVHGHCVASLDPRLDTKSTVVRVKTSSTIQNLRLTVGPNRLFCSKGSHRPY